MKNQPEILKNFIVLEGLDGSGTTTQLMLLEKMHIENKIKHWCTFEPSDSTIGKHIRDILRGRKEVEPVTLALLFAADRNEHLFNKKNGIISHLSRGEKVLCDRYLFSSLAYQSVECEFDYVLSLNKNFPLPEFLFFLDVSPEGCKKRVSARAEKDIFDDPKIQEKIYEGYERSFLVYKDSDMKFYRIDGTLDFQEISRKIWSIIHPLPI